MLGYSKSIKGLIYELSKMPGIGRKSAERIAFYILSLSEEESARLAEAIRTIRRKIKLCSKCFCITEETVCDICNDQHRKRNLLCVVEETKDVIALEKTKSFSGLYHVLGGKLAPLDGVGPEELNIEPLLNRIKRVASQIEVVLATGFDTEGDATAIYLAKLLKPLNVKISRIAHGIPLGSSLDYTDNLTLARAMEGRRTF